MIDQLVSKRDCCGCKACGDICPAGAINYKIDRAGFWSPEVDMENCIKCKKCVNACPVINKHKSEDDAVACYGAINKDDEVREYSTSGGIFSILASYIIKKQGIVVGAAYVNNTVKHIIINNEKFLDKIRKSKYVQSDLDGIYQKVKQVLNENRLVLFSGTPCQIEALYNFLGKKYDTLYTIDLICCGVPSPKAFSYYLKELGDKYKAPAEFVWFKNKEFGWHNLGTKIVFKNGKKYFKTGNRDYFMSDYIVDGLTIRSSCTSCRFRCVPHRADITLGDFWGVENLYPQYNDEKGTSAVIVNTPKGNYLFEQIKNEMIFFDVSINDIKKGNFALYKSKEENVNKDCFFEELDDIGFFAASRKYGSYKGLRKLIIDLKFIINKYFRRKRNVQSINDKRCV